jgi:hypothetical protein
MKKHVIFILLGLSFLFVKTVVAQSAGDAVYLETISTPDKSLDFIVGLYPDTYYYNTTKEYSTMTLKILNNSTSILDWNDYKVYIQLSDGTLFYNYKTQAESGEYCNSYTISTGLAHSQTVCFTPKFRVSEISKVYLSFNDNKFFALLYIPAK